MRHDFAIVGMDCLLPGADGAEAWIRTDRPSFSAVPDGRWPFDPATHTDPTPGAPDAATTRIGAFVTDPHVDLPDLDTAGLPIDAMDPLFRWVLRVVGRSLDGVKLDRSRTGLWLANLGLPTTGAARAIAAPYTRALDSRAPWLEGGVPTDRWHSGLPAQLAARAYDLQGAVSIDAACASGLYALQLACERLATGELDAAVAAAVNRSDSSYLFMGFSQLRALSPTGTARPLDRAANGLIIGEGAVAVVVKRLHDAIRDGDPIQAVIRGAGLGNDGRKGNMLAPDASGQLRAMRAAWSRAGLDPATVGTVECHATGTAVGDGVELDSLHRLLAESGATEPVSVHSGKALIGHTVTAAGLAGLLRAVGAVRDGVRLPAVGVQDPHPAILASPHLTVLTERTPWPAGRPRRAAASAFGFGGTNAHLVVDAFDPSVSPSAPTPAPGDPTLAVVGLGLHVGDHRGTAALDALRAGLVPAPAPLSASRGCDLPAGTYVSEVTVDPRRYRIPPIELADLLPQQLLMLDVAADALHQAGSPDGERTASIVGMGVDQHVAEPILRWALPPDGDSITPALTASRVQGSLPNFVANRIASQFDLRGPSYTVSSGPLSGLHALQQAARLLAINAADAVLVGAVDLPGHLGSSHAAGDRPVTEGAVALVVMRLDDARAQGRSILAELGAVCTGRGPAPASPFGGAEALDGLLQVVRALALDQDAVEVGAEPDARAALKVSARELSASDASGSWDPVLAVPHSGPPLESPGGWTGPWDAPVLPLPRRGPPSPRYSLDGSVSVDHTPLDWPQIGALNARSAPPLPSPARPAPPTAQPRPPARSLPVAAAQPAPLRAQAGAPAGAWLGDDPLGLAAFAAELERGAAVVASAHEAWLDEERAHLLRLARFGDLLIADPSAADTPPNFPLPTMAVAAPEPPRPEPPPADPAATIDLLAHAGGPLSAAFGPDYADLDHYTPRVRMPMPPLLLCHRVVNIEGERGTFGPSRIVTEYDIPTGAAWSTTGRPPPCVMVESGQADLLLVSYLGIDAENRGERVYRLLDCDLTFHGPLPEPGETLRHDIRIDSFARLGATTLFYFHYDCVSTTDGRAVLSMRNGCAGFFTPGELATPRGVLAPIPKIPEQTPLPLAQTLPEQLDRDQIRALTLQPLGLPPDDRWRLVHRVLELTTRGGAHGLGTVVFDQDLRDDDWFNPCHFVGDPCMPGTLMFDGCTQALQLWLLAHGLASEYPDGSFEPLPESTAKLRCRGQVVPGHKRLRYKARIKAAGLTPTPWVVADVVLEVDGTDVVLAEDVGVCVRGERRALVQVDDKRVMEYSVGSAEIAFGPAYTGYDGPKRCARMPGPPYLTMSRVHHIEGPAGEIAPDRTVVIDYDVPPDAWYFRADPCGSMPFAVLLETALQPCGWLTAWQQMAIEGGRDLYFRNLGGEGRQFAEVWPHSGTLRTTATLTSTSASGGMRIVFFTSSVMAGEVEVFRCTTSFGYFSLAALSGQKGLLPPPAEEARVAHHRAESALRAPFSLAGHDSQPRDDWRMLHRVTHANSDSGREKLGFYQAAHTVDPDTWFFHAHFHLDPVMPGSLGLEALLQLARYALVEQLGPQTGRFLPLTLDHPVSWLYRGQVLRPVTEMTVELDVLALEDGPTPTIRCSGIVRADGLAIYRFDDFGLQVVPDAPALPPIRARTSRPVPAAALIDTFTIDGDVGQGVLHLDPALHPWLADHCPTVTAPAVPMAFAAEIAAEAALLLRPGLKVVGLPELSAERWIHTADGPVDLLIIAVADGDAVAVTLAVYEENARFPKLSGPKPHMRAVVQLGTEWAPAEAAPAIQAPKAQIDIDDYYNGGHTFHGPTLQGMTAFDRLGPDSGSARFHTRPDAELLGIDAAFALDPLLLDTATHPMYSAAPERWVAGLTPGKLAYPVSAANLRFFGPRPQGTVSCSLRLLSGDPSHIRFHVHLAGPNGPYCAFEWTEAIVDAGPFLGQPAAVRRTFLWDRAPAEVRIGRATTAGWRVDHRDLVEPLPGTLAAIACSATELVDRAHTPDRTAWDAARLAAKEAVRSWLRSRIGRDVHPASLTLLAMRPDRFVVVNAPDLTAAEFSANLGPTRFDLRLQSDETGATATMISRRSP